MKKGVPICHHCDESSGIKKHGITAAGFQRYFCMLCKRSFQTGYTYKGREQYIAGQIERLLLDGLTPEQISEEIQVEFNTVKQHVKKLSLLAD
ncbi:IS1 family transposase [Budviciaceae bacterium CWB-B4]|uniref:IS1 family transposase n=1 Tax=Limnobaculum xujianqingii TaxID=2738837 RepID=A0A9D7AKM1_9GAMM|nr:hypothetical protein [Limnobaculum xujianqingii]MBK5074724.1 IS1 family transposase [Limnobaculum xujianqingii]MBK5177944.1 IS1 family transposase [Limnobaculum xujianqingii]